MAGKGVIFFTLGTLFGGLCSATVAMSWPSPPAPSSPTSSRAVVRTKLGAKGPSRGVSCPKLDKGELMASLAKPWFAAGAALGSAQSQSDTEFTAQTREPDQEQDAQEAWTPEQEQAFFEQEEKLHQERQEQIEKMRHDLVSRAKLNPEERGEFLSLVKEVTQKLLDKEKELNAIMGPIPLLDPGAPEQEQPDPPEDPPRLALLQNDFERSKALLSAQTRFEALLGPERLEALGPQFQSVEAFIKDEPLSQSALDPIKGDPAPETDL